MSVTAPPALKKTEGVKTAACSVKKLATHMDMEGASVTWDLRGPDAQGLGSVGQHLRSCGGRWNG